jgi:hypothetical protein
VTAEVRLPGRTVVKTDAILLAAAHQRLRVTESAFSEVWLSCFYLDLLFYHVRLHRYFVFELKVGAFQPEHAGKLGFYLAAVNGTMRTPVEGPSIGVLLCESRSGPIVEFALETINQPIGVSTYHVTRELPAPMREELPTVEDLQEVVNKLRSEMESLRKEAPDEE